MRRFSRHLFSGSRICLVGQSLRLMAWERDAICKIYDNPATTRRAIISVGRKSGKTTFAACLLGALDWSGGDCEFATVLCGATAGSGALLYQLAAKMVRMSPALSGAVICKDVSKQLHCPGKGTVYRALSAEVGTS